MPLAAGRVALSFRAHRVPPTYAVHFRARARVVYTEKPLRTCNNFVRAADTSTQISYRTSDDASSYRARLTGVAIVKMRVGWNEFAVVSAVTAAVERFVRIDRRRARPRWANTNVCDAALANSVNSFTFVLSCSRKLISLRCAPSDARGTCVVVGRLTVRDASPQSSRFKCRRECAPSVVVNLCCLAHAHHFVAANPRLWQHRTMCHKHTFDTPPRHRPTEIARLTAQSTNLYGRTNC